MNGTPYRDDYHRETQAIIEDQAREIVSLKRSRWLGIVSALIICAVVHVVSMYMVLAEARSIADQAVVMEEPRTEVTFIVCRTTFASWTYLMRDRSPWLIGRHLSLSERNLYEHALCLRVEEDLRLLPVYLPPACYEGLSSEESGAPLLEPDAVTDASP